MWHCSLFDKGPGRRGGGSLRGRDSPRWQLVEGRYKGNLDGQGRRKSVGGAEVDALLKGATSSPASFDNLSKARLKVKLILQQFISAIPVRAAISADTGSRLFISNSRDTQPRHALFLRYVGPA